MQNLDCELILKANIPFSLFEFPKSVRSLNFAFFQHLNEYAAKSHVYAELFAFDFVSTKFN